MVDPGYCASPAPAFDALACITVTYHPDLAILRQQLQALPSQALKIIVDNGSGDATQAALSSIAANLPAILVLPQPANLGLPAAINLGVRVLAEHAPHCTHILLLDQDSVPMPGSIARLCEALAFLEREGKNPGAVGPQLRDVDTGLNHGFHQMRLWRWHRAYPPTNAHQPIAVANLNGSGTLMRRALFERLGGLDETLFIDHVDTEWSFRMSAAGYTLWGIPDAVFRHRMGERGLRFWLLGWRVWPARSAIRHRYLFRNAVWLMRRPYVPTVWKVWAVLKLFVTAIVHAFFDPDRCAQLSAMVRGVRDGLSRP
ncbi:glycosyltransferase family 2 protein [Hydrogenophilus islandicus]